MYLKLSVREAEKPTISSALRGGVLIAMLGVGYGLLAGFGFSLLFFVFVVGTLGGVTVAFAVIASRDPSLVPFGTVAIAIVAFFLGIILEFGYVLLWTFAQPMTGVSIAIGVGVGAAVGVGIGVSFEPMLGLSCGLGVALGWTYAVLRPLSILKHWMLSRYDRFDDARWRQHPVIRFRRIIAPFPGLDRFIVAVWETRAASGLRLARRLIRENPTQQPRALRALARITARRSRWLEDLLLLSQVLKDLPEGEAGYMARTIPLREKAEAISRWQQQAGSAGSAFARKLALMGALEAVTEFRAFVSGCESPLVEEFSKACDSWQLNLRRQIEAQPREVPPVFAAELDLRPGVEAFVRRDELLGELEKLLLHPAGGGGLLLYARRRMGKSTILKNLQRLLPQTLSVAYVSLQSAEANTSTSHLAQRLGDVIRESCPEAEPFDTPADLPALAAFLRKVNDALENADRRLLSGLDEYEVLDEKIGKGAIAEDVLALMRDAIQQHRRIRWLVSGVHHFGDLTRARWSSYLTAFQTVEVRPFSPEETHQLLTDPLRHAAAFSGRTPPDADFFRDFWHAGAVERIYHESQGWPALAQGIAREVVRICHRTQSLKSTPEILEKALDDVLESMSGTLTELMLQGVPDPPDGEPDSEARALERAAGAWLRNSFRTADEALAPADDRIRKLLTRHELIADPHASDWKLRVPLMLRWLKKRG